jgi:hypothetical protein
MTQVQVTAGTGGHSLSAYSSAAERCTGTGHTATLVMV